MRQRTRRFLFGLCAMFTTLVTLEFLLQILAIWAPALCPFLPNTSPVGYCPRSIKDPLLVFRPNPAFPDHDPRGFRNMGNLKKADIVALGDSQTYGMGVKPQDAWPQQLEWITGQTVYNMAFGGYGPIHSLYLWDEAMMLHPRLVIEALYSGNDLYDSYEHVYDKGHFPELKDLPFDVLQPLVEQGTILPLTNRTAWIYANDKFARQVLDFQILHPTAGTNRTTIPHLVEEPADTEQQENDRPVEFQFANPLRLPTLRLLAKTAHAALLERSRGYYRLYHRIAQTPRRWSPTALDERIETIGEASIRHDGLFEKLSSETYSSVFTPRYRLHGLDLSDPRIQEGWRLSLEALDLLQQRADRQGLQFRVLLIPTKELAALDYVRGHDIHLSGSYDRLVDYEQVFWRFTREYLDQRSIRYIDSLPALQACLRQGRQPYPTNKDGHPNQEGYRVIAELLAPYVQEALE
ncbi:MAG: hypothetical protein V2A34_01040 [Lentisphaerota bacterium]